MKIRNYQIICQMEMKVNRPQAGPGMATPVESEVSGGGSKNPWIILGFVVVVIVVLGGGYLGTSFWRLLGQDSGRKNRP